MTEFDIPYSVAKQILAGDRFSGRCRSIFDSKYLIQLDISFSSRHDTHIYEHFFYIFVMSRTDHICLMATYNEWMNAKLYEAAMGLPDEELVSNRKAPFSSLLGILNHLVVGDTIGLKRFVTHPANYPALELIRSLPAPSSLDQLLFTDIQSLSKHRKLLDQVIVEWDRSITDHELDHVLNYTNTKGMVAHKNFFSLVMHFFNHQTHHRGQATTLLWQSNVDIGVTDLLALIPDEAVA